jgi:hypothetical protein
MTKDLIEKITRVWSKIGAIDGLQNSATRDASIRYLK